MSIHSSRRHDDQPNYDPVEQGLADDLREVPHTTQSVKLASAGTAVGSTPGSETGSRT
jgi:hypothetical protein